MVAEEGLQQLAVLSGIDGAGGIDQLTARLEQGQQGLQEAALQQHQLANQGRGDAPAGIGVAGQGAQARAGGIQQDAIKPAAPLGFLGRQLSGIGNQGVDGAQAEAGGVDPHPAQAALGAIHRPHLALVADQFSQVGALAAGGSAGIEDALAGLGIQQQPHRLGRAILHAPVALPIARQVAQLTAAAPQREAIGQLRQGGRLQPGGGKGLQHSRPAGAQGVDAQVEGGGLVAGGREQLGLGPLHGQLRQPGGQGVAQAQAAGGIGGQGAQAIPGLRFGPRAPAPASPK